MTSYVPGTLKGLIDSTPDVAVLVNLAEFYAPAGTCRPPRGGQPGGRHRPRTPAHGSASP